MWSDNLSSSTRSMHAVVIYSSTDLSRANSLVDELRRRDVAVVAANAEADLDAVLRHVAQRYRPIVYLSQSVSDLCNDTLLRFAHSRGREAVVVVLDDGLKTMPDGWADFLRLRYSHQRLSELCRELAMLIRTPPLPRRPQDITGYAVAFRVFNGYLRFVLPNFHVRLKELYKEYYASCVKKLLIICPASCRCKLSMEVEGIEHSGPYVLRNISRAGQPHRDLSVTVYSIRDDERNCTYYFAADFDNSLVSLCDIHLSGLAGIDDKRMYTVRNEYILHLQQLLQYCKDDRQFTGQYRILYWKDHDVSLANFLLSIVREEMESPPAEVFESPTDFPCVDGPGVNPGSLYADPAKCYKLDTEPYKGMCLIINITKFDSSAGTDNDVAHTLEPRTGTEADVRQLDDTFQWLKFEVVVHTNVNKVDFLRIINDIRELDHSKYDTFVCCIMSHGYLGYIYTADRQSVALLEDIAYAFCSERCPTLDGKPKIFFIQSCQITGKNDSVAEQESHAAETPACAADSGAALDTGRKTLLMPDAPDFFMFYSTLPRRLSYRDEHEGTFYVKALTEVLKKGLELQASFYEVAQRVEQKAADSGAEGQQRPVSCVSTDHKFVYLCGPRCKTVESGSFIDRAAADQMRYAGNPTGESLREQLQNPGHFPLTAGGDSFGNNQPKSDGGTEASCLQRRRHYEVATVATKPKDPFDYHVYVGCSPANYSVIEDAINILKTRWNLIFSFDMKKEECEINYRISCSEKCLLYVTAEYIKERWCKAEATAAVEKARRFSMGMLFVLKDPQLCRESLKELDLQEFQQTEWPSVDESEISKQLVEWLLRPTELAEIPQMPEKISGYYEAMVYFFGYLTTVLHDHRQKMETKMKSIDVARSGARVFLPMLIVVPESCRAPKSFDVEGKLMFTGEYIVTAVHRAGSVSRDYKMPVVKMIVDAEKNDVIYFSGEFPAVLLTLYETCRSGLTGVTENELGEILADFYATLQSLLCHPDNRHCIDQYRLVLWPDKTKHLDDFLLPVLCGGVEEGDASSLVVGGGSHVPESSFSRLESSTNLCTLRGGSRPYAMRSVSRRGICLIINISDVTQTSVADVQGLFEQFNFDVSLYDDAQMTSEDLDELLCDVAFKDHSPYDAFVCYIASRGRLCSVLTSDGIWNSAANLLNIVGDKNCETLCGKPKLFLMQTIDDGTNEDSSLDSTETQQTVSASSSSGQRLSHDALSSMSPVKDGETLVPSVADVVLSAACLPISAVDRCPENTSVYTTALTDHLRAEVDVMDALNKVNKQFEQRLSQFAPHAKAVVVSTVNRPLLFPSRRVPSPARL